MRIVPLVLSVTLALTACADGGQYPSLLPRRYETGSLGPAPPPPLPPAPPARPEIVSRAAALVEQARDGQRAFAAALGGTRAAVAQAGGAGSESWITAQEAVSGLDASRTATVTALAEVDALTASGVDAAGLRFGDNDFATLRAAASAVYEIAQEQGRAVDALSGSLAAP